MFVLKTVFWLSLLVLIIPTGNEAPSAERSEVSTSEILSATKAVWNDLSAFCERNPETCETGHRLAARFGDKARDGARVLYQALDAAVRRDGAEEVASRSADH